MLAEAIGPGGLTLCLSGPLGSGKTVFVKGLAAGLGISPDGVVSPTFTLAHLHSRPGGAAFWHADLYRLEGEAELEELGLFDFPSPEVVIAIEWGERFQELLPSERMTLQLARVVGEPDARVALAEATGSGAVAVLERWFAKLVTTARDAAAEIGDVAWH